LGKCTGRRQRLATPKKYGYYDGNWARWGGLDSDAQRRKTVEKNSAKIVDSFMKMLGNKVNSKTK
jgi:hypothetical protein